LWWTDVEIHTAENELRLLAKSSDGTPEVNQLRQQIESLEEHRRGLFGDGQCITENGQELVALLGRFEPPGTPLFEYAMELRAKHPVKLPLPC
jgi:hypothetical protein